jgi:hypothetical protein
MSRRLLGCAASVVLASSVAIACDAHGSKDPAPPATQVIPVQGFTPPPAAIPDATSDAVPAPKRQDPDDLAAYLTAAPQSGKSIGHTSVVFRLKLEGGLEAAYKPRSKRGPSRYKGEIAAYRLAKALGLPNVPPAMPRSFARATLLKALGGEGTDAGALLVKEGIVADAGDVPGAIIPWIPHLELMALEEDPLLSLWRGWLDTAEPVPEEKRALAAQISTLIVFDYVTGNWDRWSGGNVGFSPKARMLLFVDNDGAFYDTPPAAPLAAQKERLTAVRRFSRTFVRRLRTLDAAALRKALGDESPDVPLLGEKALAGVDARREEALRIIDARIKKSSEDAVLDFE